MTVRAVTDLRKQAAYVSTAFVMRLMLPAGSNAPLQWGLVGLLGLGLGIYAIAISTLSQKWIVLLVLAGVSPFVALVVGNVRRVLLAIIILDIPLQLDINLAYRPDLAAIGAIGGWNLSLTTMALTALYMMWLTEGIVQRQTSRKGTSPPFYINLPLALYLLAGIVSIVAAQDIRLSTFKIFLLVQMFLLYIYVANTVRTREDVLFIISMLLIGLALEGVIMIGLRIIGRTIETGVILARIDGTRVGGTVGSPNSAAGYLSLLLAPAMSLLLTRLDRVYKWLAILAFSIGTVALVLTLSRGGWIAFVLSMTALCLLAWYRGLLSPTIPMVLAIVAILLAFIFQDTIVNRVFGDDDGSASSRIPLMMIAYRMIINNLAFGVGINNFALAMWQYARLEIAGTWLYVVHNKYLLVWAEVGTAGFTAFILFLLTTIRRGWQSWLGNNDRSMSLLALGFTVSIAGHMVHMFVDLFQNRPLVQTLWLCAALVVAINKMTKARESQA